MRSLSAWQPISIAFFAVPRIELLLMGTLLAAWLLAACGTPTDADDITPSEISWPEAVELINQGEVWQVAQTHSLEVTLYLDDGRTVLAMEPNIDEVFAVIERCGDPCSEIIMMTE